MPYGQYDKAFPLPVHASVSVLSYLDEAPDPRRDPVKETLLHPVGGRRLRDLASGRSNAVIIISDGSRLCPSHLLLGSLLDELNDGGIPDKQIKVIVALGMHRKHTGRELAALAGEDAYRRVQVLNHSSFAEDCVPLGTTKRGTPVEINRHVVEAELRIATGNVEPHRLVGMSGGIKAVIPGCASAACIEANHALSRTYRTEPGQVDNPVHEDLEEAQRYVPIHFLLNVVVNHRRDILAASAGDPILAHRRLLEAASRHFLVEAAGPFDMVIASPGGHPKDVQLYQAVKTLQNAAAVAKPGSPIVLVAECREQFGNGIFQHWVETMPDRETMVRVLKERFVLGAHKMLHIDEIVRRHEVFLHSSMPPSTVELLGFQPLESLEELPAIVNRMKEPAPAIAVMPYGALTFVKKGRE